MPKKRAGSGFFEVVRRHRIGVAATLAVIALAAIGKSNPSHPVKHPTPVTVPNPASTSDPRVAEFIDRFDACTGDGPYSMTRGKRPSTVDVAGDTFTVTPYGRGSLAIQLHRNPDGSYSTEPGSFSAAKVIELGCAAAMGASQSSPAPSPTRQ